MSIIQNHGELLRAIQKETLRLLDEQERLIDELKDAEVSLGEKDGDFSTLYIKLNNERAKVKNLTMTVAVVGTMKAGKSTLLNAIIGDEILPSRELGMTAMPLRITQDATLAEPLLKLDKADAYNKTWQSLRTKMQELQARGDDIYSILKLVGERDAETMRAALLDPGNWQFTEETSGQAEVTHCLLLLNDLLRFCAHEDVNVLSPLESIETYEDLPKLCAAFSSLTTVASPVDLGHLEFIDTPGPNEVAQGHLQDVVNRQLDQASAIILVLNYTQLNTKSDAEMQQQVGKIVEDYPNRVHIVVSRFDQKGHKNMTEPSLRNHVTDVLFKGCGLSGERVLPLSGRDALLAQQALRSLEKAGSLPSVEDAPWVETFGSVCMGKAWRKNIADCAAVRECASIAMEESGFSLLASKVVEATFENAAAECLRSALEEIGIFTSPGSNSDDALRIRLTRLMGKATLKVEELRDRARALESYLAGLKELDASATIFIKQTVQSFIREINIERDKLIAELRACPLKDHNDS